MKRVKPKLLLVVIIALLVTSGILSSCKKEAEKPYGPITWLDGSWKLVKKNSTSDGVDNDSVTSGCQFLTIHTYDRGTYSTKYGCPIDSGKKFNYKLMDDNTIRFYVFGTDTLRFTETIYKHTDNTYITYSDGGGGNTALYYYKRQK
jgi:hypothetical protein